MREHGLYVIKKNFFSVISSLGGDCDMNNGTKRPVYCCIQDSKIDKLFWAIPTSDLSHRSAEQMQKIHKYISLPNDDMRSCYYHIGRTTRDAIYKISSCFPVTDKYIDHEFTTNGKHVIIQRKEFISEIDRKLKRILAFEAREPNYFKQRITDIKTFLINELHEQGTQTPALFNYCYIQREVRLKENMSQHGLLYMRGILHGIPIFYALV